MRPACSPDAQAVGSAGRRRETRGQGPARTGSVHSFATATSPSARVRPPACAGRPGRPAHTREAAVVGATKGHYEYEGVCYRVKRLQTGCKLPHGSEFTHCKLHCKRVYTRTRSSCSTALRKGRRRSQLRRPSGGRVPHALGFKLKGKQLTQLAALSNIIWLALAASLSAKVYCRRAPRAHCDTRLPPGQHPKVRRSCGLSRIIAPT